ncbi:MAG TPA: hypothetical protein VFF28_04020 [Candidatus Nanoarchaeia archaeon]|nr:hypothetical protein [Candidatus Nanoarchaeia archaeon]
MIKEVFVMSIACNICNGDFEKSPDSVVLCKFKEGMVHLGCCVNNCSWDRKVCSNASAVYDKIDIK